MSVRASRSFFRLAVSMFPVSLLFLPGCGGSGGNKTTSPPVTGTNFVYTANAAGTPSTASAFTTDASTGALTAITGSPYPTGTGSVALAADSAGKFLFVANYFSSDISAFSVNATSGALSVVSGSSFPAELGVKSLAVDPAGKFLYAVSERSENLWAYSISASGVLAVVNGFPLAIAPAGTASDSVVVDPSGKFLFVTNRDSFSESIYGFTLDISGGVTPISGFPLPLDGLLSDARFNPAGTFLLVTGTGVFGSDGGLDVFSLNPTSGALTKTAASPVQVGAGPSAVAVDSTGKYVYVTNTSDATVSAFSMDGLGALTTITGSPFPSRGAGSTNGPLGIASDNAGHFVYVCSASNDISVFTIGAGGGLSPITGTPFPDGGNSPSAIVFLKKP